MLSFLPGIVKAIFGIIYLTINTLFWTTLLFTVSAFRLAIPVKFWYRITTQASTFIADSWITINNLGMALLYKIDWDVEFTGDLKMDDWYLVLSNHQTWIDIIVLQKVLIFKIPFLKFFLKKELIWVPLLGAAWWSLEFPFMKRYSKEFLKKNPHLKGKDIESTRKACEKYKTMPVSIMNFMEGTRFTEEKHSRQQSPYKNLLKPKAGGISLVMSSMGDMLKKIADVTIYYPEGPKTFWEFLNGRVSKIVVKVDIVPITDEIRGDYVNDPEFSVKFQNWLNDFWAVKDKKLSELKKPY